MKAVELPLVESTEHEGVVYLLFPGFEEKNYQGVQYELYPEKGLVYVYCYEQGFEEGGDAEGMGYPVAVPEEDRNLISQLGTLQVVDPEVVGSNEFPTDEEYERVMQRFNRFTGST